MGGIDLQQKETSQNFRIILYPEYEVDIFQDIITFSFGQGLPIKNHEDPFITFKVFVFQKL